MNYLQRLFFVFAFVLVIIAPIYTMVVTIQSIEHIHQHIDISKFSSEDLVVFDLDNTVMQHETESVFTDHGLKAWAAHYAAQKGLSLSDAFDAILPYYFERLSEIKVKPVEQNCVQFIQLLQRQGVTVIGWSSRSPQTSIPSIKQLESIGIKFSRLHSEPFDIKDLKHPARYEGGIYFCGNNRKSDVFKAQLAAFHKIKRVCFFDDQEKHVLDFKDAVIGAGLSYYGFRYAYLDEHIKNFKLEHYIIPDVVH